MELTVELVFFDSALGSSDIPVFSAAAPHTCNLIVEGSDLPLAVRLVHAVDGEMTPGTPGEVHAQSVSPEADYSALVTGKEFFIMNGPRMAGRGRVLDTA